MVSGFNHIDIVVIGNDLTDDVKSKLTQFKNNNKPLYVNLNIENMEKYVGIANRYDVVSESITTYSFTALDRVVAFVYTEETGWVIETIDLK